MKIRAYTYHKRAEQYCDCQDSFGIDTQNYRIAISDGMSQSIYPKLWADILVKAYLKTGDIPQDISSYQLQWQEEIHKIIAQKESEGRNPWRLKNSIAEKNGAGATICGFSWAEDGWECKCLGDSCLIAINSDYSLNIYTSQVGEFGNHPDYRDSFNTGRGEPKEFIRKSFDDIIALLLVTDPFAELFEKNETFPDFVKNRYAEIYKISTHDDFVTLVENWRDNFGMHNDDSTLILLTNFDSYLPEIEHEDSIEELCRLERNSKSIAPLIEESHKSFIPESHITNECNNSASEEAVTKFQSSVKEFIPNYKGKKSKGKIKSWFEKYLNPIIDNFMKE